MSRLKTVSKLLELKKAELERQELNFRKAKEEFELEKEKLNCIEKKFEDNLELLKLWYGTKVSAREIELFYDYFKELSKKEREQKKTLHIKLRELEERKKCMLDAYRENRILELLSKRIKSEEEKKKALWEQKWIDFLSLSKRIRK